MRSIVIKGGCQIVTIILLKNGKWRGAKFWAETKKRRDWCYKIFPERNWGCGKVNSSVWFWKICLTCTQHNGLFACQHQKHSALTAFTVTALCHHAECRYAESFVILQLGVVFCFMLFRMSLFWMSQMMLLCWMLLCWMLYAEYHYAEYQ